MPALARANPVDDRLELSDNFHAQFLAGLTLADEQEGLPSIADRKMIGRPRAFVQKGIPDVRSHST